MKAIVVFVTILLLLVVVVVAVAVSLSATKKSGVIKVGAASHEVVHLVSGQRSRLINVEDFCKLSKALNIVHTEVALQTNKTGNPWSGTTDASSRYDDDQIRSFFPPRSNVSFVEAPWHLNILDLCAAEGTMELCDSDKHRMRTCSNQFYTRHLAFRQAVAKTSCPVFLQTREDNVFLQCPDLELHIEQCHKREAQGQGLVFVDEHCQFGGAISDKVFLTNRTGADVLFGGVTEESFTNFMRHWISYAKLDLGESPFQPEGFLQWRLQNHGIRIEEIDFQRTEARFNDQTLCTPELYHYCTTNQEFPQCADNEDHRYAGKW